MSIYHKFCEVCKRILTIEEMKNFGSICDRCREKRRKPDIKEKTPLQ